MGTQRSVRVKFNRGGEGGGVLFRSGRFDGGGPESDGGGMLEILPPDGGTPVEEGGRWSSSGGD